MGFPLRDAHRRHARKPATRRTPASTKAAQMSCRCALLILPGGHISGKDQAHGISSLRRPSMALNVLFSAPLLQGIIRGAMALPLAIAAAGGWPSGTAAQERSVLTYHADPGRTGNFTVPGLTFEHARGLHLDQGFEARFAGHVYAQPLYWRAPGAESGLLFVATEDDTVYALDARTGKEVWSRVLGTPVPLSSLSCGNIDPVGITGTPVIDPESEAIYLDAMVSSPDGPRHLVFALSLRDGSVLPGWPVDIADALKAKGETFTPRDQNERGALVILDGTLYVPFGGHWGDCGPYHGWIAGIPLKDPRSVVSWSARARGGGIWAQGGVATDGKSLFFATGNTFGATDWSDGEAVFRLPPDLRRSAAAEDFFAAANWRELDRQDADLGGSNPVLLNVPAGDEVQPLALALGKDGLAYLLDRRNLGGIGGALVVKTVSSRPIRTAAAAYPADDGVFAALQAQGAGCPGQQPWSSWWRWPGSSSGGLLALKIRAGSPPSVETAWCVPLKGGGSPIVTTSGGHANPIVWVVGAEGDNRLHGFRGDTGEPLFTGGGSGEQMSGLHHFQTLIAAEDRLYVAGDGRVYAFAY
jgi:outer membrane protein assembly factor BamB